VNPHPMVQIYYKWRLVYVNLSSSETMTYVFDLNNNSGFFYLNESAYYIDSIGTKILDLGHCEKINLTPDTYSIRFFYFDHYFYSEDYNPDNYYKYISNELEFEIIE
jgi:hypothetical protein